jgi:hypothetical protein
MNNTIAVLKVIENPIHISQVGCDHGCWFHHDSIIILTNRVGPRSHTGMQHIAASRIMSLS